MSTMRNHIFLNDLLVIFKLKKLCNYFQIQVKYPQKIDLNKKAVK